MALVNYEVVYMGFIEKEEEVPDEIINQGDEKIIEWLLKNHGQPEPRSYETDITLLSSK